MRVDFCQSGGVAGLLRGCDLDSNSLSPEDAAELGRLVAASGISASGTWVSKTQRDRLNFELTIEDGGKITTVAYDETTLPESARGLLAFLRKRSQPRPL